MTNAMDIPENQPPWVKDLIQMMMTPILNSLDALRGQLDDVKTSHAEQTSKASHETAKLKHELSKAKDENIRLKDSILKLQYSQKRCNLILDGIPESESENCSIKVNKVFRSNLGIRENIELVRCFRIGREPRTKHTRPRQILAELPDPISRRKVWDARSKLKGTNIYMSEDFPIEVDRIRRKLRIIAKAAKDQDPSCRVQYDTLLYKGHKYTINQLESLPAMLHPINLATKQNDRIYAFGGPMSDLHPMGNFYEREFCYNGRIYPSSEHAIQHTKAVYFDDHIQAVNIMNAPSHADAKRLGDAIKGSHGKVQSMPSSFRYYSVNSAKTPPHKKCYYSRERGSSLKLVEIRSGQEGCPSQTERS